MFENSMFYLLMVVNLMIREKGFLGENPSILRLSLHNHAYMYLRTLFPFRSNSSIAKIVSFTLKTGLWKAKIEASKTSTPAWLQRMALYCSLHQDKSSVYYRIIDISPIGIICSSQNFQEEAFLW